MSIFDTSKSLIENLSLLSGPILAILGVVAILQLRLTKKTISISSQREAAKLAASQIELYNNKIIPLQNDLYLLEEKLNINKKKGIEVKRFTLESVVDQIGNVSAVKLMEERSKLNTPLLKVLNAMDAFATYFTKGVADEDIAFTALGKTFCYSVEDLYFDLAISNYENDENYFQNTITLYWLWKGRFKQQKLLKDKENILNQLSKSKNEKVRPIGT